MHNFLSGIQQIGIGVSDATSSMHLYKQLFGMDILIFDDEATASLMTQYTGDKAYNRRAVLTLNLQGGGGFEIWQFKDRIPQTVSSIMLGDIGIYAAILKTKNIFESHRRLSCVDGLVVSTLKKCESGIEYFYVTDVNNNTSCC